MRKKDKENHLNSKLENREAMDNKELITSDESVKSARKAKKELTSD